MRGAVPPYPQYIFMTCCFFEHNILKPDVTPSYTLLFLRPLYQYTVTKHLPTLLR